MTIVNPQATNSQLIAWHNARASRQMLDKPEPDEEIIELWSQYMQLVGDDWKSLLFGWLQAEKLGIAYFHFDHAETGDAEWRLR